MPERRSSIVDGSVLVAATLLCRTLLLWALPESAHSVDLKAWARVADLLQHGSNPYAVTDRLNWPPFWMQILYFLSAISRRTGLPFIDAVRWFLFVVEALNVTLMLAIAARYLDVARPRRLLLFGVAANPISLFLVCQHANFDALVVTAMLCFTIALLRFHRDRDPVDWLLACFALGMGVLVKTIPFVLLPLLAIGLASIPRRVRAFGALLFVTPAAIGMSVIYVLSPATVTEHVLRYRSYSGWFGITGLLELARLESLSAWYARLFPLVLLASLAWLGTRLAKLRGMSPRHAVLLIAALLVALIALGPGYGEQYLAWPLPFLVLSFPLFDRQWSRDLLVLWIAVSLTVVAGYALFIAHGAFLLVGAPHEGWPEHARDLLSEPAIVTLFRLPLFAGLLWILAAAGSRLRAAEASDR